jgi:phosphatidylglycerol---prolipoprotein diacylglyceryl transferase
VKILHYVFELGAYTIGVQLFLWQRRRVADTYHTNDRLYVSVFAVAGAFVGSRLLGMVEHPSWFGNQPWLAILGQKTIVGGIIGATASTEWAKLRKGLNQSSGDALVVPLIVAMIVGRIGCHLGGLEDGTFGVPSSLPWAIDFGDGIPRHPTNLYEILFLVSLLAWYWLRPPLTHVNGVQYQRFFNAYMIWRVCVDGLKPTEPIFAVGSFPVGSIQLAAIAALIIWNLFIRSKSHPRT